MSNDRLQKWALIAEIVGGIVVFTTMIVLIMQVRENTTALRAQELGEIRGQHQQLMEVYLEHADVYVKGLRNPSKLTPEEIWKVNTITSMRITELYRFWEAYQTGILLRSDWENKVKSSPIYLSNAFTKVIWEQQKNDYPDHSEFVAEIEAALENSPIIPDDEYLEQLLEKVDSEFNSSK